jgi:hypothetical protein
LALLPFYVSKNGIAFDVSESRETPRRTIGAQVRLKRRGASSYRVRVHDISEHGCKVDIVERPSVGETVWVKFEQLEPVRSTVRWAKDFAVGLEFDRPIDVRVLEWLLSRLR